MKKFYFLTKTLLVAALLMVGASNVWADATITTTTYDFKSMGNVTFTLSSTNLSYAYRQACYLPNEEAATDDDKMNSNFGFSGTSISLSSTNGLTYSADRYTVIKGFQEGDYFIFTFSGDEKLKAVTHKSGSGDTPIDMTSTGADLAIWTNLVSGEAYFASITTTLGFQTKNGLKISKLVVKHVDSSEYLRLFRLLKTVGNSTYASLMTSELAAAKTALISGSTDESTYSTAYAVLKAAYDAKYNALRNDTYKLSTSDAVSCGDVVGSVYGVSMTYGGLKGTNTWTVASTSQAGLTDLGYTATATTNEFPQKADGARTSDPTNPPTKGNFWVFTPTVDGELEFAGLFPANRTTYCGPTDGSESKQTYAPGASNYYGSHTFSLSANKTYYIWTDNNRYGMLAGFKFTPSAETVKIGATGYTTFASKYALDLSSLPSGLTAYYASSADASTVTLSPATGKVPAQTGLVFKGTASTSYNVPIETGETSAIDGNLLVGCITYTNIAKDATSGFNNYVMVSEGGTAKFQSLVDNGATIPAGKAYLKNGAVSLARELRIEFADDILTGISEAEAATEAAQKKGKFIVDGKLVIFQKGMKFNANGQLVK